MKKDKKIGIFDSGLGGLIVAKAIHRAMPEYEYVYFGDTKRVPYGNKSPEAVYEFTREAVDYLFRKENCGIVIIACNTASGRALRKIQQEYLPENFPKTTERKVLGVLIPAAEVAAQYKRIGVLATRGTVDSNTFKIEIEKFYNLRHGVDYKTKVFQNPAPILVPLIEEGDRMLAKPFLLKYLKPLMHKNLDALVLGCTHYPILKNEIKKILKENKKTENVKIISQEDIIPKKLKEYLKKHQEIEKKLSKNKSVKIIVTDKTQNMEHLVKKWFNH